MPPDRSGLSDADRRTVLKALGAGAVLGGATRPVGAQEQKFEISVPDSVEVEPGESVTLDMSLTQLASPSNPDRVLHARVGFQVCPSEADVVGSDEIDCTPPSWTEYEIVDHSEEQGEWDGSSTAGEWWWTAPDDITEGETRAFSVTIEVPEDAASGSHEVFVICWSYPAGPRILPQPQLDERASVTVSVGESDESGDEEEEIVLTDFDVIKVLREEKNGIPQLDANQRGRVDVDGVYEAEHDIGVGFHGEWVCGTQGVYYNTFTPETSGEHKIETRFRLQGESLIKQFEFLPGTARGQNFVGVVSTLARAGDDVIETDYGGQVPEGGEVLDTDERIIYNLAVPEWSDVLRDSTIEMGTLLLEAGGRLSGSVASSIITGLQIAEILTERGVEADENIGEHIGATLLSADLKADTQYVIQNNFIAISCVDLYNIRVDRSNDLEEIAYRIAATHTGLTGVEILQMLSGSFVELFVEGGIEHVTITPS